MVGQLAKFLNIFVQWGKNKKHRGPIHSNKLLSVYYLTSETQDKFAEHVIAFQKFIYYGLHSQD